MYLLDEPIFISDNSRSFKLGAMNLSFDDSMNALDKYFEENDTRKNLLKAVSNGNLEVHEKNIDMEVCMQGLYCYVSRERLF